jgi:hypothetical protein
MTNLTIEDSIQLQRDRFLAPSPLVALISPCRLNEGILSFNEQEKEGYRKLFKSQESSIGFFIPASGSGSRMFQFLYEYLSNPKEDNQALLERFINSIDQFAFYSKLPESIRYSVQKGDFSIEDLILYVIGKNGLRFGIIPKGLIPFHKLHPFILTPFQEHLLQGSKLSTRELSFHFTVQEEYEKDFLSYLKVLEETTGSSYRTSFSIQESDTKAIAFLEDGSVCREESGNMVTRPSGHGSLLRNLSRTEGEIVFIKNIDNVQHYSKSDKSVETWEFLGGVLTEFRSEAARIYQDPEHSSIAELNRKYQLLPDSELINFTSNEEIRDLLNRPIRVCGMVRNQGQTGGGPFWVREDGRVTKQIVEKAQIASSADQLNLMVKSTHFNPVMIAACCYSFDGEKFDLESFVDHSKYFKVTKTHLGEKIGYIELPGLWNGSMAHWTTIFVEIPSEVFSPVKTIIDLLDESHRS